MSDLLRNRAEDARTAAREAIMQELETIGRRRKSLLGAADAELERLAAFLSVAERAELNQSEIADRAAVSRQTLLNLRREGRGRGRIWNLDLLLMLELAFVGPRPPRRLALELQSGLYDEQQVLSALDRLVDSDAVGSAEVLQHGTLYFLTPQGIDGLAGRLRYAAIPESQRWTAYVATPDARRLSSAGQSAFGEHEVAVIPVGTTREMTVPEVAFYVEAPGFDFDSAVSAAARRYAELRRLADLDPMPAHVTALVPPESRARGRAR